MGGPLSRFVIYCTSFGQCHLSASLPGCWRQSSVGGFLAQILEIAPCGGTSAYHEG